MHIALRKRKLASGVNTCTTVIDVPSTISCVIKLDKGVPIRVHSDKALLRSIILCLVKNVPKIRIGAANEVPVIEAAIDSRGSARIPLYSLSELTNWSLLSFVLSGMMTQLLLRRQVQGLEVLDLSK